MVSRRAFLLSTAVAPVAVAAPKRPVTTVLVGDSHAYMLSPHFRKEARDRDIVAATYARGGSSVRQWLQKHWLDAVLRTYPELDTVLISLGTNCTRSERPALGDDLLKLCALAGDRPVLLLPPPMKMSTDYLRDAVRSISVPKMWAGPLPMSGDGIHATFAGYAIWAEDVANYCWG